MAELLLSPHNSSFFITVGITAHQTTPRSPVCFLIQLHCTDLSHCEILVLMYKKAELRAL